MTKVPRGWRLATADALFDAVRQGTVRTAAVLRAQRPEALQAIRAAILPGAGSPDRAFPVPA